MRPALPPEAQVELHRAGLAVARWRRADGRRAWGEVLATLLPMGILASAVSVIRDRPLLVVVSSVGLGLGLLRLFSMFHDLVHRSFFPSPRTNDRVGSLLAIVLLTPLLRWRIEHGQHHAGVGNLDRRGRGDVPMMTVDEYLRAPRWARWRYRVFRCPWVTFVFGGAFLFLVLMRRPLHPERRVRLDVHRTTLASALYLAILAVWLGSRLFVQTVVPAYLVMFAGVMWMYNLQHHFEGIEWSREREWNYVRGCLRGSTCYRLPPVLAWITLHAGLHHLHHLYPDIPTYHLPHAQAEFERTALAGWSPPITLRQSLRIVRWTLYDEPRRRVVGFDALSERGFAPRPRA